MFNAQKNDEKLEFYLSEILLHKAEAPIQYDFSLNRSFPWIFNNPHKTKQFLEFALEEHALALATDLTLFKQLWSEWLKKRNYGIQFLGAVTKEEWQRFSTHKNIYSFHTHAPYVGENFLEWNWCSIWDLDFFPLKQEEKLSYWALHHSHYPTLLFGRKSLEMTYLAQDASWALTTADLNLFFLDELWGEKGRIKALKNYFDDCLKEISIQPTLQQGLIWGFELKNHSPSKISAEGFRISVDEKNLWINLGIDCPNRDLKRLAQSLQLR